MNGWISVESDEKPREWQDVQVVIEDKQTGKYFVTPACYSTENQGDVHGKTFWQDRNCDYHYHVFFWKPLSGYPEVSNKEDELEVLKALRVLYGATMIMKGGDDTHKVIEDAFKRTEGVLSRHPEGESVETAPGLSLLMNAAGKGMAREIARINADRRALAEALGGLYRAVDDEVLTVQGDKWSKLNKARENAYAALKNFDRDESVKLSVESAIAQCFETLAGIKNMLESTGKEFKGDWGNYYYEAIGEINKAYMAIAEGGTDEGNNLECSSCHSVHEELSNGKCATCWAIDLASEKAVHKRLIEAVRDIDTVKTYWEKWIYKLPALRKILSELDAEEKDNAHNS